MSHHDEKPDVPDHADGGPPSPGEQEAVPERREFLKVLAAAPVVLTLRNRSSMGGGSMGGSLWSSIATPRRRWRWKWRRGDDEPGWNWDRPGHDGTNPRGDWRLERPIDVEPSDDSS